MKRQSEFILLPFVLVLTWVFVCGQAFCVNSTEPFLTDTLPFTLIHVSDYAPQASAPPTQVPAPQTVSERFYFLSDAGVAFTQSINIANHTQTATSGGLSGAKINLNTGARVDIGVGFQLTESFAMEFATGLIWNSVSSVEGNVIGTTGGFLRIPIPLQEGKGNIYNVPFMFNGKYRLPLNRDKTHPLSFTCGAGAGGIWSDASVNNITSAQATAIALGAALSVNGNAFAFAYQANFGIEWQLANHLYLGFGYAFLGTTSLNYGAANFSTNAVGSTFIGLKADAIYTHSLLGTLRYEF
jgi:hypothetical protein